MRCPAIVQWEHVGIRVSNRERSLLFYQSLGFQVTEYLPEHEAYELQTDSGIRLNLIINGVATALTPALNPALTPAGRYNELLDAPLKKPGYTHAAFVVENLHQLHQWLVQQGIPVTEDIHPIGQRRIALFIRDPDGNVLEFNELSTDQTKTGDKKEKQMMKLYDLGPSGNCYKVRLFASLAGIAYERIAVDFLAGEHKQPPLLNLNTFGELPILTDGDLVLRDSQAILIYLAGAYGGHAWWPEAPAQQASVAQWLSVASNEIQHGPCSARLVDKFAYDLDKTTALQTSDRILGLIEEHLSTREWLALSRPTVAECAVYPYIKVADEGGIRLDTYPAIQRWLKRVEGLEGYCSIEA